MSELPRSRAEANEKGLSRYFTGIPCKNGHVAERIRSGNCVECRRIWRAGRESISSWRKDYYQNNKKKENESSRQYHLAHKAERKRFGAEYRATHQQEYRLRREKWRLENPGYCANHRAAHPEWYRVYTENRRKRESSGELSRDLVARLYKLQGGRCACCRQRLGKGFHLDHIISLSRGGLNVNANIQLLRSQCNSRKGSTDPIDFMQSKGFLL